MTETPKDNMPLLFLIRNMLNGLDLNDNMKFALEVVLMPVAQNLQRRARREAIEECAAIAHSKAEYVGKAGLPQAFSAAFDIEYEIRALLDKKNETS